MEQDPLLLQDQAEVMDVVAADKVEALKKEKMGPPGPCSSRSGSRYSMSRTCGPRDIISLVIPKLGITSGSNSGTCAHRRAHENLNISGITCNLLDLNIKLLAIIWGGDITPSSYI
jgi:hypothetical protein